MLFLLLIKLFTISGCKHGVNSCDAAVELADSGLPSPVSWLAVSALAE